MHPAAAKEKHPKHEFQVERLAFFSDAVFAIAITLLVIEFKVPHVDQHTTYAEALQALKEEKLKFLALVFSFFLISTYWIRHHLLFKYLHSYNKRVLFCNLLGLLPVIFFPFTTAFFYESASNMNVLPLAFRLFALNNVAAGILTYSLYWLVVKKHPEMSYPMEDGDKEVFSYRILWMVAGFTIVYIISFYSLEYSFYGLLPLAVALLYRKFRNRKLKKLKHAE